MVRVDCQGPCGQVGDCADFCVILKWHGHLGRVSSRAGSPCHKIPHSPQVGACGTFVAARDEADVMRFCDSITAKVFVWLAAILVPAETLPASCDCGTHCPPRAASAAQHRCCCRGKGKCCCCCCKGGPSSQGGPCHCAANPSAPAPDRLPGDSRTDNTKSPLSASSLGGLATVAILIPSVIAAHADQRPTILSSSVPERLSILCRRVI